MISSPGANIFVQDLGSGKPVVFVHGWPLSSKCWEDQFTVLPGNGFRCLGIDLRGYGRFNWPSGPYSYDMWAEDIEKVLSGRDLENVTCKVNIPTLILQGVNDQIVPPPIAQTLNQGIAVSQLTTFQNCRHALFIDQKDQFNQALTSFVR